MRTTMAVPYKRMVGFGIGLMETATSVLSMVVLRAAYGMLGEVMAWILLLPLCLPIFLVSLLPYRILHATVGKCCYFFLFKVVRYRYSVVLQNLSRALPNKSYREIEQLTSAYYKHLSGLLVEMMKLVSGSKKMLVKRVRLVNPELVNQYYDSRRNIIALLGHYGNWEVLNTLPAKLPYRVYAIFKPLSNSLLCKIMQTIRSRFGLHLLPADGALRYLLSSRQQGPSLTLFIADQYPGRGTKCRVNFLNQQTGAFNGAERLAKATDAVVIYVSIDPSSYSYDVHFSLITEQPGDTAPGVITDRKSVV